MDTNYTSPPDMAVPQEHYEGHDMWLLDDGGIIISEGGVGGAESNLDGL